MGGIPTNYHGEVVTKKGKNPDQVVPGLMAIGEAACVSVHGANRLGSNSLLDLVVFGRAAAIRAAEIIKPGQSHKALPENAGENALERLDKIRFSNGKKSTAEIRAEMQDVMQKHALVFRNEEILEEGLDLITKVYNTYDEIGITDRGDKNWHKHTIAWIDNKGKVEIDYRPVHMNTLSNEVQTVPLKKRVY
ncbi:MAG: succinate dehydrogenase flavoprotein subunit, partial [Rickettsiaceae bacterium]|nr:succinate dehydrogenase flavoprotein subunit [Rickettsiaceae bacterium]